MTQANFAVGRQMQDGKNMCACGNTIPWRKDFNHPPPKLCPSCAWEDSFLFKCRLCGQIEKGTWTDSMRKKLLSLGYCFICNFWFELCEVDGIRIEGHHYTVGGGGRFPGYSGRKFKIQMDDGKVIETTDLWHQGKVPEEFKSRLINNAAFEYEPRT